MQVLESLVTELPDLRVVSRDDAEYAVRRKIYNSAVNKKPLAIVIPKSADEVASTIKFARRNGVDISVCAGGHDLFGRALVEDAIVIDIRLLDDVQVDKNAGTAKIGGGVLSLKLSKTLAEHGCITPCPNIASVGYIGYVMTGGYGQMAHKFGLGVDHLLSASIVDANGDIVEADGRVMKGIRGAAGNFGVVVETTIKIYPFARMLAGVIIFESNDYRTSMSNVQTGMEKLAAEDDLPPELDLQPFYSVMPFGKVYGGMFMWAGPDIDRGQKYLDKVLSFHPNVLCTVAPASMMESLERNAPYVPESSYMNSRAVNVKKITPKIYDTFVRACETMPQDPAAMLTWHEVRPCSPSFHPATSLPSVFNTREPHYVIEILANASAEENYEAVSRWGLALQEELLREASEEILDASWLASTPSEEITSLEKFYGAGNARFLKELKKARDPDGVFKHAIPKI
ncbi:hypothetical protein QM012_008667 [Aureobasidium pullulans]|uniref:FAD-binding PCMH-type domain-containing protein n=1 Tax=Aureobasidium pullulans TaxID=5580 RepID=A0ABR0TLN4_AURPU